MIDPLATTYRPDLEVELELYFAYDPDLEVMLVVELEPGRDALDDDWFGTYDETNPAHDVLDPRPPPALRRLGGWLLGRAP